MATLLPVFIYARVSTDDKDQNPLNQLSPQEKYWGEKGYTKLARADSKGILPDILEPGTLYEFVEYETAFKDVEELQNRIVFLNMFRRLKECAGISVMYSRQIL